MKYRNVEWISLEHLRIKVTAPTKNMRTTAEIHNIVYNVSSYVWVGILKSWIRKRVIRDLCLNVQIQSKLHANRQWFNLDVLFCNDNIFCFVCKIRPVSDWWQIMCYRIPFPEWSNITNCLPISELIFIQVLQKNLCWFFNSENKVILRYISNRKLLVFLIFLIWGCRQNSNAKLGYFCNTKSH